MDLCKIRLCTNINKYVQLEASLYEINLSDIEEIDLLISEDANNGFKIKKWR